MILEKSVPGFPRWALWLGVITLVRVGFAAAVPLTPEESYHWNFARHLDWSYYDHPPMIAWGIAVGRLLLGDTALGVRLIPMFWSIGTSCLLARIAVRLYGERSALWAVLLFSLQPIAFGVSGSGFPDSPLLFFWTLATLFIIHALETERGIFWIAAGAALGAAMLSKYTAAFLVPSVFLHLLTNRRDRRWLRSPWLYAGAIVAVLVFSPVIYWNATHDWASFRFQSSQRFEEAGLPNPVAAAKVLGQQWLGVLPLTLPLAVTAIRLGRRSHRRTERFLLWTFLPMMGFFFLLGWTRPIHLLWPLPAHLGLTVLMSGAVLGTERAISRFYETRRNWLIGITAVCVIGVGLHAAFFLPVLSPIKGIYGWDRVAQRAKEIRRDLPERSFYLGIGRKYTVASQLAFHLDSPYDVHGKNLLGDEALQYDYWANVRSLEDLDAVVVIEGDDRMKSLEDKLVEHFRNIEPAGDVVVDVGRATWFPSAPLHFYLFRAHGYRPPQPGRGG